MQLVTTALEPATTDETSSGRDVEPPSRRAAEPSATRGKTWRPARQIAVDLGTANTLVLVRGEGVVLDEPSVAAMDIATGRILSVGHEAKRMLGRTPDGIRAVRPMQDGVIADFSVAEQMLRMFLRKVLDRHLLRVKPTVLVCVPSSITEVERRAVRDSAEGAGAKRMFMISEPMAAAIGAGLPVDAPTGCMIVDIGGGTTDIAVIALNGIVCDASVRTAGDELDQSIVQYMRKTYNVLIGEPTAELIKMRIGSAMPLEDELSMGVKGRDLVSGLPRTVVVDSAGIRDAMQESLQKIVNGIRQALEVTPPELASDILDRGITLTGGGAHIRRMAELITFETGLPVHMDSNPLTCVVRGTGLVLDDLPRWRSVLTT
jgi:rod shape-determining protein MreB